MTRVKWRKTKTLEQFGFIKQKDGRYRKGRDFIEITQDRLFKVYHEYAEANVQIPLSVNREIAKAILLILKKGEK